MGGGYLTEAVYRTVMSSGSDASSAMDATIAAGLATGATTMKVRYQGPIAAPIAKGQHVADLVIGNTPPIQVELVGFVDQLDGPRPVASRAIVNRQRHLESA